MKYKDYVFTASTLRFKQSFRILLHRVFSLSQYYILQKSLKSIPVIKKPRLDLSIKIMDEQDLIYLNEIVKKMDPDSKREIIYRILFYKSGFKNCYVAKTKNGEIAFIQWLIYPSSNLSISSSTLSVYSSLHDKQVCISNAFAFPKFRGLNLMPFVTVHLLNIAKENGYKSAILYIKKNVIVALNECIKLDFKITELFLEFNILGWRKKKKLT